HRKSPASEVGAHPFGCLASFRVTCQVVVKQRDPRGNGHCSRSPHGEPYSVRRSRKGPAGNASGPSTPAPDQAPVASSSSATTGLTAVCHTTAWHPYSLIDHWLSTTWYRYTSRGAPSLVPRTQVPAQVLPCMRSPRVAGSGRQAATTSRGETF